MTLDLEPVEASHEQQLALPPIAQAPSAPELENPHQIAPEFAAIFQDTNWAEVYAACCCDAGEALNLQQARSFSNAVAQQNPRSVNSRSQKLSLRFLRVGATAASCLALQHKDSAFTEVDLAHNLLSDHAMLSVRSLVHALPHLKLLNLSGNLIGPAGAQELAEELETNSVLEGLTLGGDDVGLQGSGLRPNAIGAVGLEAILSALKCNSKRKLRSLGLSRTALESDAGKHLGKFLERDRLLEHLDVSCNPLSSEGVCALLPECGHLRSLNLADTGCRGDIINSRLCILLQQTKCLECLSLARNTLEPRPLRRLLRALVACSSLKSLSLEDTTLDTEGVTTLADALVNSNVQNLTELSLSGCRITQAEAATALAHALAKSALLILRLNRNALGDAGTRELADALDPAICPNVVLQRLELCSCRIGAVGGNHLFACLASGNECLRTLRLADNYLDDAFDVSVIDQIPHLHEVQLAGNRLGHEALQRVSRAVARNQQQARDEVPAALRSEVHRLLFQEEKLARAREQVREDATDIKHRSCAKDKAIQDLQDLKNRELDAQKTTQRMIDLEKQQEEKRKEMLIRIKEELEAAEKRYENSHRELRSRLRAKEKDLAALQAESEAADRLFEQQRQAHPLEVTALREKIETSVSNASQLHEHAFTLRFQLKELQEKTLVDFTP